MTSETYRMMLLSRVQALCYSPKMRLLFRIRNTLNGYCIKCSSFIWNVDMFCAFQWLVLAALSDGVTVLLCLSTVLWMVELLLVIGFTEWWMCHGWFLGEIAVLVSFLQVSLAQLHLPHILSAFCFHPGLEHVRHREVKPQTEAHIGRLWLSVGSGRNLSDSWYVYMQLAGVIPNTGRQMR